MKRRLWQHLRLRGSRDFASLAEDDRFVGGVVQAANVPRQPRLAKELATRRARPAGRLAEYREYAPAVSSPSLIRVRGHSCSGPSRLRGHTVRVELHEAVRKVYLGREFLLEWPRLRGARRTRVDFRHLITALPRKPGAFRHCRHREAPSPSAVFRAAHDRLVAGHGERPGVIEYLQVLKTGGGKNRGEGRAAAASATDTLREVARPPGEGTVDATGAQGDRTGGADAGFGSLRHAVGKLRGPMPAEPLERLLREFCLTPRAARCAEMLERAEAQHWGGRKLLLH